MYRKEKIDSREFKTGEVYRGILRDIRYVVHEVDISVSRDIFKKGGAIGFFDANIRNKKIGLSIKWFPLNEEIPVKYHTVEGEAVSKLLNLKKLSTRPRPYDTVFHFENLKVHANTINHYSMKITNSGLKKQICKGIGCSEKDLGESNNVISDILVNPNFRKPITSKVSKISEIDNIDKDQYELINALDMFFFRDIDIPKNLLTVPLCFLGVPVALIVIPATCDNHGNKMYDTCRYCGEDKNIISNVINILDKTINNYVYERVRERSLTNKSKLKNMNLRNLRIEFLKEVCKVILPSSVKTEADEYPDFQTEYKWEEDITSDITLNISLGGINYSLEMPSVCQLDGSNSQTRWGCKRKGNLAKAKVELDSVQRLLESFFDSILDKWRRARDQKVREIGHKYRDIDDDIENMIDQIDDLRLLAEKIKESTSPKRSRFLKLVDVSEKIFKRRGHEPLFYGKKSDGNVTQLKTSKDKIDFDNVHKFFRTHDHAGYDNSEFSFSENVVRIVEYLKLRHPNITLLQSLDNLISPSASRNKSERTHSFLKSIIYRPHYKGSLWHVQVLTSCMVAAASASNSSHQIPVKFYGSPSRDGESIEKVFSSTHELVEWILDENNSSDFAEEFLNRKIENIKLDTDDIMSRIIQLVSELGDKRREVSLDRIEFKSKSKHEINIKMICKGTFKKDFIQELEQNETTGGSLTKSLLTLSDLSGGLSHEIASTNDSTVVNTKKYNDEKLLIYTLEEDTTIIEIPSSTRDKKLSEEHEKLFGE